MTEYLPLRLSESVKRRLEHAAKLKERTPAWLARKYIEEGLKRDRIPESVPERHRSGAKEK